jgi:hypothetical protein
MEFKEFKKIPRLYREVIVSEKIDGTNGCVIVTEDGKVFAQSRSRIITTKEDNYGFARWVQENSSELLTLGGGYHYGEWWGLGINRNYGMKERKFSLFNVSRWENVRPKCCDVVPVIARGTALEGFEITKSALEILRIKGSFAAPGFMKPEGVIAFHVNGGVFFKATLEKDDEWKGKTPI